MTVIDKVSEFIKAPGARLSREEACRLYRESGGILKISDERLLFPDSGRLISQLSEAMVRRDGLTAQLRFWQRQHRTIAPGNMLEEAMRVTDPLFWEHLIKFGTQKDYRQSFDKVDLPMKYLNDEKYRKIIRTFIRDESYRKRLVKAKTGVLSLSSDTIKESAEKNRDFKRKIVGDKVERLKKERAGLADRIRVLEVLLEWCSGSQAEEERLARGQERYQL
jgi:hypothetical protein